MLASVAAEHAGALGARELVLYLVDYEQITLQPLQGTGVPLRQEMNVDSSVAGDAFRRVELLTTRAPDGGRRMWLPLLDGVERLGVVEVLVDEVTEDMDAAVRAFVSLLAELVVVNDAYSDTFSRLRRRKTMSLAAEIQWELLPPLTFGTDRVVITGMLEPAYEIGGDSFDYAVNASSAHVLVLDAVGHGLPAALLSSAVVNTYRHARREMVDLPDIAAAMDEVIVQQFGPEQFATALIARLDIDTGHLRWVNAGHPAPLILRSGGLVHPPPCRPNAPLGLQSYKPTTHEVQLERGDGVLFYTDGIVEARSPGGDFFGEERLAQFVLAAAAEGSRGPETMRRLMRQILGHQSGQLQDDASIVFLEWATGDEQHMQL